MRRVLKPGGVLFLVAAWNSLLGQSDGFQVRPFGDFNWRGKLVKASIPVQQWTAEVAQIPTRGFRWAAYGLNGGNEHLYFRRLQPNYSV